MNENPKGLPDKRDEVQARRDFLKKVGTASVAAPAVALLLSANATSASAQSLSRIPTH
jgi:hypothetical protein